MFSIKILCEKSNISQQTFYRLVRENEEFRALVESNREKKGNGYRYDTPVLEWLSAYYDKGEEAEPTEKPVEASTSPVEPLKDTAEENISQGETDALKADLEALQAKYDKLKSRYDKLKADYEALEGERKTLLAYQGNLLYLLTQEKNEKQQLLLAPPHKTIGEKIKGLFKREKPVPVVGTIDEEPKP